MNKVLFCGAGYGAGNMGDDAILEGLLISARMYLREDTEYGALTYNPAFTKRGVKINEVFHFEHDVEKALRWATHVVFGGASLLSGWSIEYCSVLIDRINAIGKPVCMLAAGTSIMPNDFQKGQLKAYFGSLDMITLRSEADRKLAIKWGLHPDKLWTCADGAFAIDCTGISCESSNLIGINLVHEGLVDDYKYVDNIAKYLSGYTAQLDPYFICGEARQDGRYDYAILKRLYEQFGGDFFYRYVHYKDLLNELAKCRLVITMRMHIMLFCALIGIPCIPIIRAPKLKLMLNSLGLRSSLSLSFSVATLKQKVNVVVRNPKLGLPDEEKLEALKLRAFTNGELLCWWMRKEI